MELSITATLALVGVAFFAGLVWFRLLPVRAAC
jgi:hypothetical protein